MARSSQERVEFAQATVYLSPVNPSAFIDGGSEMHEPLINSATWRL
jgi:hypothetical protein